MNEWLKKHYLTLDSLWCFLCIPHIIVTDKIYSDYKKEKSISKQYFFRLFSVFFKFLCNYYKCIHQANEII